MKRFALILAAALATGNLIACASGGPSEDQGQTTSEVKKDPPGNDGTVKIQEVGDDLEVPDNDPHVGCQFQIEFRGYDEGDLHASWSLTAQPPSGPGTVVTGPNDVFIGEDPAGGANDVDAVVTVDMSSYDLSGLFKHPTQGYHLKLTVHADGSKGSDVKHKVFWTDGCQPPPAPACGDGNVNEGEQCDDGNLQDGDGCSVNCTIEEPPPPADPVCGDGNLDEGEQCDDGNLDSGDGCSPDCTIEELPPPPPPTSCDPDAGCDPTAS